MPKTPLGPRDKTIQDAKTIFGFVSEFIAPDAREEALRQLTESLAHAGLRLFNAYR